jgi:hypothetical protein
VIVSEGVTASTTNVRCAGVSSTPAALRARTRNVCSAPSASGSLVQGEAQANHVSFGESMHSNVACGSSELNVKRASRGLRALGPEPIVVSGGTIVKGRATSAIGCPASSARTRKLCSPSASEP